MSDEDKAIERLHTDASGVPGPDPQSGLTWLNSVDVVDRLVREFARLVIGELGKPDFLPVLEARARFLNELLIGPDEDVARRAGYSRGPWNTPEHCGLYVRQRTHIEGDLHVAVRDAFLKFALDLVGIMQTEAGPSPKAERRLEALIAELRNALLGTSEVA